MKPKAEVVGFPLEVEDYYTWYYVCTVPIGEWCSTDNRKSLGDLFRQLFGYARWRGRVKVTVEPIDDAILTNEDLRCPHCEVLLLEEW